MTQRTGFRRTFARTGRAVALLAVPLLLAACGSGSADTAAEQAKRGPFDAKAREIFEKVISIPTQIGNAKVPYTNKLAGQCGLPEDLNPFVLALKFCVLSFLLLVLIFTDAETKLLPDLLTKPGIGLVLAFSLLVPVCDFRAPAIENWRVLSLLNSAAGALLGWTIILGIALLYEAIRGIEGMGRGDVKLMGLIGAFLGVKLTLLLLSPCSSAVMSTVPEPSGTLASIVPVLLTLNGTDWVPK